MEGSVPYKTVEVHCQLIMLFLRYLKYIILFLFKHAHQILAVLLTHAAGYIDNAKPVAI